MMHEKEWIAIRDDDRRSELGRFLRSRRERLTPQDVGLSVTGTVKRRTKGLRREEIAVMAGISLPWYTSLEQGRDINVSDQVLDSVARVLKLTDGERSHLFSLVSPRHVKPKSHHDLPHVPDAMQYLLNQMPLCPAYISDHKMNVLAWNDLAAAVFGDFTNADGWERNMLWRMYRNPSYRALFVEWQSLAGSLLGEFRSRYTQFIDDPWYEEFIADMTANSPEFAAWWQSYEVTCTDQHPRVVSHPSAGLLHLSTHLFPIQERDGLYLTTFIPDASDGSVDRLTRLIR